MTNEELIELLRNRAKFDDRISARAANRLEAALVILHQARSLGNEEINRQINELLTLSD